MPLSRAIEALWLLQKAQRCANHAPLISKLDHVLPRREFTVLERQSRFALHDFALIHLAIRPKHLHERPAHRTIEHDFDLSERARHGRGRRKYFHDLWRSRCAMGKPPLP